MMLLATPVSLGVIAFVIRNGHGRQGGKHQEKESIRWGPQREIEKAVYHDPETPRQRTYRSCSPKAIDRSDRAESLRKQ